MSAEAAKSEVSPTQPSQPQEAHVKVMVAPVTGAPSDGNRQLYSGMRRALGSSKIVIVDTAGADVFTVIGNVNLTAIDNQRGQLVIKWLVAFAEEVARTKLAQGRAIARDDEPAVDDDIERVALVAFARDVIPVVEVRLLGEPGEALVDLVHQVVAVVAGRFLIMSDHVAVLPVLSPPDGALNTSFSTAGPPSAGV